MVLKSERIKKFEFVDLMNNPAMLWVVFIFVFFFGVVIIESTANTAFDIERETFNNSELLLGSNGTSFTLEETPTLLTANRWNSTWLDFDGTNDRITTINKSFTGGLTLNFFMSPNISDARSRPTIVPNWYSLYYNANSSDLTWFVGNGSSFSGGSTVTDFVDYNSWQMVSVIYNGTDGILYKNGLVNDSISFSGSFEEFTGLFSIGSNAQPIDNYFNGSIDHFSLLNNSVMSSQISRYYNESLYGKGLGKSVPILSYHAIKDTGGNSCSTALIGVCEQNFSNMISYLVNNSYQTITYQDYYNYINGQQLIPDKPIIITFDDIDNSTCSYVESVLDNASFIGVQNIISGSVGSSGSCTWADLSRQQSKGWGMQSHGVNGSSLLSLKSEDALLSLQNSKSAIEGNLSVSVIEFQYPSNQRNSTLDDLCSTIYEICVGNATNYPLPEYAFKSSNLTHDLGLPIFRINVENLTTLQQFQDNLNYRDFELLEYRLNENSGTTAHDLSTNGNNGTISGATWENDGNTVRLTNSTDYVLDSSTFTITEDPLSWSEINASYDYEVITTSNTTSVVRLTGMFIALTFVIILLIPLIRWFKNDR